MTLDDVKKALSEGASLRALVLAADPMVYLLQVHEITPSSTPVTTGFDQPITLKNNKGENLVYRSRYAADQACAQAGFSEVTLIHESAYGEMVGLPSGGDTRLRQTYPVKLDLP